MVVTTRRESDSSTVTVSAGHASKIQQALNATKSLRRPRSKSVTFNLGANRAYANTVMPREDCAGLWSTPQECQLFKERARTATMQIVSTEKNYRPNSYAAVLNEIYDLCIEVDGMGEERMEQFLTSKESKNFIRCMGLVKYLGLESGVRSVSEDKAQRRRDLLITVQKFRDESTLRKKCQRISRVSCLFARLLAEGLEVNERQGGNSFLLR